MPSKLLKTPHVIIPSHDLREDVVHKALLKLLTEEYGGDLEKLRGKRGVYSLRAGQAFRIVLAKAIVHGISSWVVMELLPQHEYEQSHFLKANQVGRKASIQKCINDNVIYELNAEANALVEKPGAAAPQANVTEHGVVEYNEHYITLDSRQSDAMTDLGERTVQVLCGEAGSGKTLILLNRIAELAQILSTQSTQEECRRIWVIVPHLALQRHLKQEWENHSIYSEILANEQFNSVNIVTPEQFYRAIDELDPALNAIGEQHFTSWLIENGYDAATKLFGRIPATRVYQELCIFNGLASVEAYQKPELAEILLETTNRNLAALYLDSLLEKYRQHLAKNNQFDPALYVVKNQPSEKDYYIGDETQNLPPRLLGTINKMMAMNDSQSTLLPRRANEVLLKFLHKNDGLEIRYCNLEGTYRCPQMPLKLVSNLDAFSRNNIIPRSKHATTSGTLTSLNPELGLVSLVDDLNDESPTMKVLKQMVKEPGVAVICLTQTAGNASKTLFPEAWCAFGPDNPCTGLEFERVILLNPFDDDKSTSLLGGKSKEISSSEADEMIQRVVNPLKIAATRTKNALVVIQNRAHKTNELMETLLNNVVLSPLEFIEMDANERARRFYEQASDLYRHGQHEMAFAIIAHIGGDLAAFKKENEPCFDLPKPSPPAVENNRPVVINKNVVEPRTTSNPEPLASLAPVSLQPTVPQPLSSVDDLSPSTKNKLMAYANDFFENYSPNNFKALLNHSRAHIILFELKLTDNLCLFSNLLMSTRYAARLDSFFKEPGCAAQIVSLASTALVHDDWLRFLVSKKESLTKHLSPELYSWRPSLLLAGKDSEAKEKILGHLIESNAISQFGAEILSEKQTWKDKSLLYSFITSRRHRNNFLSKKASGVITNAAFLILGHSPYEGVEIILTLALGPSKKDKDKLAERLSKFKGLFDQIIDSDNPNKGASIFYFVCTDVNGCSFLSEHWDNFKKRITVEGLFAQVTGDGAHKGMSPFYWLCANDSGRALLLAHWDDFKERITVDSLFAQVTGDGADKGTSPFYWLCASVSGCSLLSTHWDDFKGHITTEGLFGQVIADGLFQGTSPFYYLCANDSGRSLLSTHWDDFKKRITVDGLFAQVTGDGPHQGISPFESLCVTDSGRSLLSAHWDDFNALISIFKKAHPESPDIDRSIFDSLRKNITSPTKGFGLFSEKIEGGSPPQDNNLSLK